MAAARYHPSSLSLLLFLITLFAVPLASANAASIATYWGQNKREGSLAKACATGNYEYINIAFLTTFGSGQAPVLDLSGHCNASRGDCAGLARDIRYCQKWGIKVMLSLGGDKGKHTLNSTDDAGQVAQYLYSSFLGGNSSSPRPFGSAVLDGIDFSVAGRTWKDRMHWGDLAMALARYNSAKRKLYLTASPQCAYPDKTLRTALRTGLFDFVWIHFYNHSSCQYSQIDGPGSLMFAWEQWNTDLQVHGVFIGLPASSEVAENGYVPPANFTAEILPFISSFPKYWGVMLWDRYRDKRSKYSYRIKYDLMIHQTKNSVLSRDLPT